MSKFVIEGGAPLNGTVRPSGNKNEALPVLMACLLTSETVTFERVPRIQDVLTVCLILEEMGVEVRWEGEEVLHLTAKNVNTTKPSARLCADIRASILLMGPMLARMGAIELPLPGGDVIGARRIDTHWEGIETSAGFPNPLGTNAHPDLRFPSISPGQSSGRPQSQNCTRAKSQWHPYTGGLRRPVFCRRDCPFSRRSECHRHVGWSRLHRAGGRPHIRYLLFERIAASARSNQR